MAAVSSDVAGRRFVRRVFATMVMCLLGGLVVGGWQSIAQAAPKLESSSPEEGESIPAGGPVEIVLRFNEALDTDSATVVLLDEDGRQRMKASAQVQGETLQGLLPEVPPGDYQASYDAWTTSGQKVSGKLPFSISAPAVSFLGVDLPTWAPTALIVLFIGLAVVAVLAIVTSTSRH